LDLADGLEPAYTFRDVFQERGYELIVPPTVVSELTLKAQGDDRKAALSMTALQRLREWGIHPYDLKSVGHGITEEFARRLIARGLLPEGEFNDGLILAETSLAGIPALVTSDGHLTDIPSQELEVEFDEADLSRVTVAHPGRLLRALIR